VDFGRGECCGSTRSMAVDSHAKVRPVGRDPEADHPGCSCSAGERDAGVAVGNPTAIPSTRGGPNTEPEGPPVRKMEFGHWRRQRSDDVSGFPVGSPRIAADGFPVGPPPALKDDVMLRVGREGRTPSVDAGSGVAGRPPIKTSGLALGRLQVDIAESTPISPHRLEGTANRPSGDLAEGFDHPSEMPASSRVLEPAIMCWVDSPVPTPPPESDFDDPAASAVASSSFSKALFLPYSAPEIAGSSLSPGGGSAPVHGRRDIAPPLLLRSTDDCFAPSPRIGWRSLEPLAHGYDRTALVGEGDRSSPDLNRPLHDVLCRWILDGWDRLRPRGDGDPTSRGWRPVYPFATGEGNAASGGFTDDPYFSPMNGSFQFDGWPGIDWTLGFPSRASSPWLFGHGPIEPSPFEPATAGYEVRVGGSGVLKDYPRLDVIPWIRISKTFFFGLANDRWCDLSILPQGMRAIGSRPLQAQSLGLAVEVLRTSLPHFRDWLVAERDLVRDPVLQAQTGTFDIFPDVLGSPGVSLIQRAIEWVEGERGPIHLLGLNSNIGGIAKRWHTISFRRTALGSPGDVGVGANPAIGDLASAAISAYVDPSRGFNPTTLRNAAERIANLSALVLHELLHVIWREEFDMLPWFSPRPGWGCDCRTQTAASACGPPLSGVSDAVRGQALKTYQFVRSHPFDLDGSLSSKHYAIYLAQSLYRGLLKHDVSAELRANTCN
jgi:hypothetical protein